MRHIIAVILLSMLYPGLAHASQPSPLVYLSDAEKSYYVQIFDYSMETVKPGEKYDWSSYSGKGTIAVSEAYISKSGATCRNFSESFRVRGQNGIDEGVSCKRRGKDGWCKLDLQKEAKTCSFEDTGRMFGGVNITMPSINAPSIGSLNMPDIGGGGGGAGPDMNMNMNVNTDGYSIDKSKFHRQSSGGNSNSNDNGPKGAADSITGEAGSAATSVFTGGLSWFSSTFLR